MLALAVLAYLDTLPAHPLTPSPAQRAREIEVARALAEATALFEENEAYLEAVSAAA